MLTIVPTPIGNLKDITLRALETLKEVDGIVAEDSRRTSILLDKYQIKKPILILNDFNENSQISHIIENLKLGKNIALVSDAGTPLISDPGFKLIREAILQGIEVDSLPGAVSGVVALTLSGLPPDKFYFIGYLPEKPGHRLAMIKKLEKINKEIPTTFIIFVAPHKLIRTLGDIKDSLGNIEIVLAKELTKIYQSVKKQSIEVWLSDLKKSPPKGEYIMLINLNLVSPS